MPMGKVKDETGKRYGKLTVIKRDKDAERLHLSGGYVFWECLCDCGNTISVSGHNLRCGDTKSCGCIRATDMTGQKFGKLTAIKRVDNNGPKVQYLWQCDCGNKKILPVSDVVSGNTKSCGCLKQETTANINFIDITGKTFNELTVLEKTDKRASNKHTLWKCQCSCGNIVEIDTNSLISGHSKSCGHTKIRDITGERFGKLIAQYPTGEKTKQGSFIWHCVCDCGNECDISVANLVGDGHTRSCGCIASLGEQKIEEILKSNNINYLHDKRYFKDLLSPKGYVLRYDFILISNNVPFRIIEFDGIQHYRDDSSKKLSERQTYDQIKNQYAFNHNIPIVRIPYWEIDNITIDTILKDKYLLTRSV